MNVPAGRQVRLRPEFAQMYPMIPPGEWLPSAEWAERIVERAREARRLSIHQRTFDPDHFDFRGGPQPRGPGQRHLRTRLEDRGPAGTSA